MNLQKFAATLNFWVTNRIPRVALSILMGKLSRIEHPWFVKPALMLWRSFGGLEMEATQSDDFKSIRDCFVRGLAPGSRPFDAQSEQLLSPSDGIVGMHGVIQADTLLQAKGMGYTLTELLDDGALAARYEGGYYLTIRISAAMYHRFHAPSALSVSEVIYHSGDAWNVNPPALQRVPRLFCKNERAVIRCRTAAAEDILLIPVAAVLVAGIRLHCLEPTLNLSYRGANRFHASADYSLGEEMGWFEHGSTIILCLPTGFVPAAGVETGVRVYARQPLLSRTYSDD